jgi:hypothetical protein
MAQKVNRTVPAKGQKRDQQWTLMMVSDDGEIRTARQRKGLRNLLIIALAISLMAAGGFYLLWQQARKENAALHRAVAVYKRHLSSMGVDQEELLSLLAVYQPAPETAVAPPQPTEASPPAVSPPATEPAPPPEPADEPPVASYEEVAPLVSPVGIEDFQTTVGELSGALTITFKVTNIDPDMEKAEGHVILVLRPETDGIGGGLALPPVTLVGGRPTGNEAGQAFSISNFKRVRFTAGAETNPERFETATVFIFSDSGNLWMEEDFPIETEAAE